jgi:hypothetical protein
MNNFMKRDCVAPKGERILIYNLNSSRAARLRRGVRLRLTRSPQSSRSGEHVQFYGSISGITYSYIFNGIVG